LNDLPLSPSSKGVFFYKNGISMGHFSDSLELTFWGWIFRISLIYRKEVFGFFGVAEDCSIKSMFFECKTVIERKLLS
jgi:hypothetical protein